LAGDAPRFVPGHELSVRCTEKSSNAIPPGAGAGLETAELRPGEGDALAADRAAAGLVIVFAGGRAMCRVHPVDAPLLLGREAPLAGLPVDASMSRRHAIVSHEAGRWRVVDLDSRNGTLVDGLELHGERAFAQPRVLRIGETVALFTPDVRAFVALGRDDLAGPGAGLVQGPRLAEIWRLIGAVAGSAKSLHVRGVSGTGKALAARAFHDLGPRRGGPFVAVNCAAIPPDLAERLLFGAKRGAFTGADADSEGFVQAADRGTLFLDEIGELDLGLQAKLLRVLETREVLALGATRARKVDVRLVSATHRDLRALVEAGRFRQDLYFRLGRPDVRLPPLRDRAEEIAFHVVAAVRSVGGGLVADASLVEACLLRAWPGNVRELLVEVAQAAQIAAIGGSDGPSRDPSSCGIARA